MPKNKGNDLAELLRQILRAVDAQIADLQGQRAQLTAMLDRKPTGNPTELEAPKVRRKMSTAAKAKIRAAAKARWARVRAMKAKEQPTKAGAKKGTAKTAKTQAAKVA